MGTHVYKSPMKRKDYLAKRKKLRNKYAIIETAVAEVRLSELQRRLDRKAAVNIAEAMQALSSQGLMMAEIAEIEADSSSGSPDQLLRIILAILRRIQADHPNQPCPVCGQACEVAGSV